MNNPFLSLHTVEAVKKEFRRLCFVHHPDHGGQAENFRELNRMYQDRLAGLDGSQHTDSETGKTYTYTYNSDREKAVAEKLSETLKRMPAGVDVYLIGIYIWCMGDTKPHKEALKAIGYRWHSKRLCWYWKPEDYRSRRSRADLSQIASKYGCKAFKGDRNHQEELALA